MMKTLSLSVLMTMRFSLELMRSDQMNLLVHANRLDWNTLWLHLLLFLTVTKIACWRHHPPFQLFPKCWMDIKAGNFHPAISLLFQCAQPCNSRMHWNSERHTFCKSMHYSFFYYQLSVLTLLDSSIYNVAYTSIVQSILLLTLSFIINFIKVGDVTKSFTPHSIKIKTKPKLNLKMLIHNKSKYSGTPWTITVYIIT